MSGKDTVFDRILRGEAPAEVVHDDEDVLAFRDVHPQAPLHILVIPKRRAAGLDEMLSWDSAQVGRFFQGVARVAAKMGLSASGYRVVVNCGRDAQQSVGYLHAHVLGGRHLRWPPG